MPAGPDPSDAPEDRHAAAVYWGTSELALRIGAHPQSCEGEAPTDARRRLGQYYTPVPIADLITRLTVRSPRDRVLDPGCGPGVFLAVARNYLGFLAARGGPEGPLDAHGRPEAPASPVTGRVLGYDVDSRVVHQANALVTRTFPAGGPPVEARVEDFFDATPPPGRFTVVLGNPPYVEQRQLDKATLEARVLTGALARRLKRPPALDLSRRSDLTCYFITHAWNFLQPGGRAGFIVSDRLLDTDYGAKFQALLLRLFHVRAVIALERQSFHEALVGNVILVLEKPEEPPGVRIDDEDEDNEDNDDNDANAAAGGPTGIPARTGPREVVRFLRLKAPAPVGRVVSLVDAATNARFHASPEFTRCDVPQALLAGETQWTLFFQDVLPLYALVTRWGRLEPLGEVARLRRGVTSGANAFFHRKRVDLPPALRPYFTPLFKSLGQARSVEFGPPASEWLILDVAPLVAEFQRGQRAREWSEASREAFREWLATCHPALARELDRGEQAGYHKRATCRGRARGRNAFWFNLGPLVPFEVALSMFYWRVFVVPVAGSAPHVLNDQLYYVTPRAPQTRSRHPVVSLLAAWLNSRFTRFFLELLGRKAKGARLDRIQLKVYEAKELPSPVFPAAPADLLDRLVSAWTKVLGDARDATVDLRAGAVPARHERLREALDRVLARVIFPESAFKSFHADGGAGAGTGAPEPVASRTLPNFLSRLAREALAGAHPAKYSSFLDWLLENVQAANERLLRLREKGGKESAGQQVVADSLP